MPLPRFSVLFLQDRVLRRVISAARKPHVRLLVSSLELELEMVLAVVEVEAVLMRIVSPWSVKEAMVDLRESTLCPE